LICPCSRTLPRQDQSFADLLFVSVNCCLGRTDTMRPSNIQTATPVLASVLLAITVHR